MFVSMLIFAFSVGAFSMPISAAVSAYIERPKDVGDYMLKAAFASFLIVSITVLGLGSIQ